jgi:uncharacterized protein (TIGR00730 family)
MTPPIGALCVFCGSSPGAEPAFAAAASSLGTLLAERQIRLIYGGGHVGLMGVVADAALRSGGEVHGVITAALLESEVGHHGLTRLDVAETMHERKAIMAGAADAFVMLPGGIGTFEEFFEAATWTQLGIHAKPCGIVNVEGYFDPLLELLDRATDLGFVRLAHRQLIVVAPEPATLIELLEAWQPPARAQGSAPPRP